MLQLGYIKLHRSLTKWEWYGNDNTLKLFIHLLLTANYYTESWQGIAIERGQRLTSYQTLSDELRLSVNKIRTAMDHLKLTGEITVKTTSRYQLITIAKYGDYQGEAKEGHKQNHKQEHHPITDKSQQSKKANKAKNIYGEFRNVLLTDEEFEKLKERYGDYSRRIEDLSRYIESKGKNYRSHYATILNWARKEPVPETEGRWKTLD